MAKKKNKKEIAKLRAQVEILKSQLAIPYKKSLSHASDITFNVPTTQNNVQTPSTIEKNPATLKDFRNSAVVSLLFFALIASLYITYSLWYPLIRF